MKFQCQWVSVSAVVRRSRPVLDGCIPEINKVVDKLVQISKSRDFTSSLQGGQL